MEFREGSASLQLARGAVSKVLSGLIAFAPEQEFQRMGGTAKTKPTPHEPFLEHFIFPRGNVGPASLTDFHSSQQKPLAATDSVFASFLLYLRAQTKVEQ